jgi:hypothetical protein
MSALLDTAQIAALLHVSRGSIVSILSKMEGFPPPVQATRPMRWDKGEVWRFFKLGDDITIPEAPKAAPTVKQVLARRLAGAQRRSRLRKRACTINMTELLEMYEAQGGKCAVSGIRFLEGAVEDEPFSPTIDRIDSLKGYEKGNVRIVCLSVNLLMNRWGDEVFKLLIQKMGHP